jgi:hypothetical protein
MSFAIQSEEEFYRLTTVQCLVTPGTARKFIGVSYSRWYKIVEDFERWEWLGEIYVSLVEAVEYVQERKGRAGHRIHRIPLLPMVNKLASIQPDVFWDNAINGKALACFGAALRQTGNGNGGEPVER